VLSLSPALVLFVVLVGWKLGGITGIAFGVPAVAVIQALAERVLSRRNARAQAATPSAATPQPPVKSVDESAPTASRVPS
jgi:predicted PurR-regulated permease PerM